MEEQDVAVAGSESASGLEAQSDRARICTEHGPSIEKRAALNAPTQCEEAGRPPKRPRAEVLEENDQGLGRGRKEKGDRRNADAVATGAGAVPILRHLHPCTME